MNKIPFGSRSKQFAKKSKLMEQEIKLDEYGIFDKEDIKALKKAKGNRTTTRDGFVYSSPTASGAAYYVDHSSLMRYLENIHRPTQEESKQASELLRRSTQNQPQHSSQPKTEFLRSKIDNVSYYPAIDHHQEIRGGYLTDTYRTRMRFFDEGEWKEVLFERLNMSEQEFREKAKEYVDNKYYEYILGYVSPLQISEEERKARLL